MDNIFISNKVANPSHKKIRPQTITGTAKARGTENRQANAGVLWKTKNGWRKGSYSLNFQMGRGQDSGYIERMGNMGRYVGKFSLIRSALSFRKYVFWPKIKREISSWASRNSLIQKSLALNYRELQWWKLIVRTRLYPRFPIWLTDDEAFWKGCQSCVKLWDFDRVRAGQ